jgi:type II secretory pathway pseudopilin PulG
MKTKRGYSFLEILFAVFVVTCCATIVTATLPTANQSRYRADNLSRATNLAQKQLERIRGAGYGNLTATQMTALKIIDSATTVGTNTWSFTNSDVEVKDNPASVLPSGTGRITVELIDQDLKRVTVTVNWNERGINRSYSLGTLIANL